MKNEVLRRRSAARAMACCWAFFGLFACAGLIPQEMDYFVHMDPILPEGRGDYTIDLADSAVVFSKEGLLVRVKYLTDDELNRRFPPLNDGRDVNPYTHGEIDRIKRYVPPRFTVFEIEVINNTYAKIEFDPAKAVMESGGEIFRYYDPGREGAVVRGANNFTKYYKMELGTSGNEREINLERMGIIYKTVYHRGRPIFKADRQAGFLVFDPIPEENREVTVVMRDFVLSFDASGNPEETIDISFKFHVDQGVLSVVATGDGTQEQ